MTVYLGLDIGKGKTDWAATATRRSYERGTVTLENFEELLEKLKPISIALEWTGRLGEPYAVAATKHGIPCYIIHPLMRQHYAAIAGQSTKTDALDAKTVCKVLSQWKTQGAAETDGEGEKDIRADLFISYSLVAPAWALRGLMADYTALTEDRKRARTRITAFQFLGATARAGLWSGTATSDAPERAMAYAKSYAEEHYPQELTALLSIPGIGNVCALWILATLMPIERFIESDPATGRDRTLGNIRRYLGMNPKVRQSGTTTNETKKEHGGHRNIRGLLFMAALTNAKVDNNNAFGAHYKRFAVKFEGQPTAKKRAINRVGHLYLRIIISLLRSPRLYVDRVSGIKFESKLRAATAPHLTTQAEAARRLGVTRQAVTGMIKNGHLTKEEVGKKTFVNTGSLEKFIVRRGDGTGPRSRAKGKEKEI